MSSRVTRRQLAAALGGGATLAAAQVMSDAPKTDLAEAQEQMRKNTEAIAKVPVPQTLEPAFLFRA